MNGHELESVMRHDPHTASIFQGVYASDTLPRALTHLPALFIVNTDPSSKPGTHWQAMFIDKDRRGEFFDSYGMAPFVQHHINFLKKMCKSYKYNHVDLQAIDSSVCGQYCVMYLLFKAHGFSMTHYVKHNFTLDCKKNDQIVDKMFKRYSKNVLLCNDFNVKNQSCCKRRRK